jgi:hemerythrin-like domain-containing protein
LASTTFAVDFSLPPGPLSAKLARRNCWTYLWIARSLLRFLEDGLETHIAKEEQVLSPQLRPLIPADDRLIDEMVAEHDLIHIKRDDVQTALAVVLADYDDLRSERRELRTALTSGPPAGPSIIRVRHALEIVVKKLRVHFESEEELVFLLVAQFLNSEVLDRIAANMAAFGEISAPQAPQPRLRVPRLLLLLYRVTIE